MIHDYWKYDGLALAELIRRKELTASELIDSAIEACARLNPSLNFMAHNLASFGRAAARRDERSGPFSGVPFLLKDIGVQMKDTPYECGSRMMRGFVSSYDTTLTQRFARAGLITVAKSTTPEYGAQITTESLLTGVTRNPWNLSATPGGSSGGAAAAVAAGVVPIGHANDGLGSIRIPASNCGLFGLKPTRQRTPTGPKAGETSGGRAVDFVVSRSVRDSAALLDEVHGMDPGAPYCAPAPPRPYLDELTARPTTLRIAYTDRSFSGAVVSRDCADAARSMATLCTELGHRVDETAPPFSFSAYLAAMRTAATASFAGGVESTARSLGREASPETLEPLTWLMFCEGRQIRSTDYFLALDTFFALQRGIGEFFECYDMLITPMLAHPPADIGWLGTPNNDLDIFWDKFAGDAYSPFAGVFNITGQPAASIPVTWTSDSRPIGVQLVAPFGAEGLIFRLAAQIEHARPWIHRLPAVHISHTPPATERGQSP